MQLNTEKYLTLSPSGVAALLFFQPVNFTHVDERVRHLLRALLPEGSKIVKHQINNNNNHYTLYQTVDNNSVLLEVEVVNNQDIYCWINTVPVLKYELSILSATVFKDFYTLSQKLIGNLWRFGQESLPLNVSNQWSLANNIYNNPNSDIIFIKEKLFNRNIVLPVHKTQDFTFTFNKDLTEFYTNEPYTFYKYLVKDDAYLRDITTKTLKSWCNSMFVLNELLDDGNPKILIRTAAAEYDKLSYLPNISEIFRRMMSLENIPLTATLLYKESPVNSYIERTIFTSKGSKATFTKHVVSRYSDSYNIINNIDIFGLEKENISFTQLLNARL